MSLTSILLATLLASAPGRATAAQVDSGGPILKVECRTFDRAVFAIENGAVVDGVRCLHVAAGRGEPLALRALGLMRLRGQYLPRDEQEAVALFHQAARLGDAESMYLLGKSFKRGIGVTEDQQLARFWLERAAARGYLAPPSGGR